MNNRRSFFPVLENIRSTTTGLSALLLTMFALSPAHSLTNDRDYQMGDDGDSPAAGNGLVVGTTYDSAGQLGMGQLHDLVASGSPVYRSISGRPDGGSGLGIEFNGSSQYLRGARFGLPETTPSSFGGNFNGTLNYNGLSNRGFQFWVQPSATGAQSLVMDTNQHGARINSNGNFSMRYANIDYDSDLSVNLGNWYHVMVVRPQGAAGGAQMYVDGIGVTAATDGYDGADTSDLVVGSNTAGDDGFAGGSEGFLGGNEEFFSGIIDDLSLFVLGDNSDDQGPPQGQDYGSFNFATDNHFAAFALSGVAGDVDNNGSLEEADKTAFINGWMHENLVNDIRLGDLESLGKGDLNFDGITDIQDLLLMQTALPIAGLEAITSAELQGVGVPEPTTALLLLIAFGLAPKTSRLPLRCRA